MGYALLCVAVPDGQDVKIETVTEEELLDVQLCAWPEEVRKTEEE